MAVPLYFFPGLDPSSLRKGKGLSGAILESRGLAGVLWDVTNIDRQGTLFPQHKGPAERTGAMLCVFGADGQPPASLGYFPDRQVWHSVRGGELWIGLDKESPPGPRDLQRANRHAGHLVELGDGNQWEVPVIRSPSGRTSLPRALKWNDAGEVVALVKPDFAGLWEEAGEAMQACYIERGIALDRALAISCNALALNYRFGRDLQNILGLIDTTNWEPVLFAMIDAELIAEPDEAQKKKRKPCSVRWSQYSAWAAGLAADHRPSRAELFLRSCGVGISNGPSPH